MNLLSKGKLGTIQVLRHQRGGVRKWQFLMIYSTVNHQRGGWVGLKSQKHDDVILEWSLYYRVGNEIDFFFPLEWTATKTI